MTQINEELVDFCHNPNNCRPRTQLPTGSTQMVRRQVLRRKRRHCGGVLRISPRLARFATQLVL
jgi:hypothetical protein